jgi:hypothetical protein
VVTRRSAEVIVIAEWISVGVGASGAPDICLLHVGSVTTDSQFAARSAVTRQRRLRTVRGTRRAARISRPPATSSHHDRLLTLATIGLATEVLSPPAAMSRAIQSRISEACGLTIRIRNRELCVQSVNRLWTSGLAQCWHNDVRGNCGAATASRPPPRIATVIAPTATAKVTK